MTFPTVTEITTYAPADPDDFIPRDRPANPAPANASMRLGQTSAAAR